MTSREKLHRFVDELTHGEETGTEDAWALANAREAVREEPR